MPPYFDFCHHCKLRKQGYLYWTMDKYGHYFDWFFVCNECTNKQRVVRDTIGTPVSK